MRNDETAGPARLDRRTQDRIAGWFANGLRDVIEASPDAAITPSNPNCQGATGPHPYTDVAYKAGADLGRRILADGARSINVNPPASPSVTPQAAARRLREHFGSPPWLQAIGVGACDDGRPAIRVCIVTTPLVSRIPQTWEGYFVETTVVGELRMLGADSDG